VNQAKEFFQYTNFDGTILTKSDADAKGGAAISVVHITNRPILFLGTGQSYDDLVEFDAERFLALLLQKDVKDFAFNKQDEKNLVIEFTAATDTSSKSSDTKNTDKPSSLISDGKLVELQQSIFKTGSLYNASSKASEFLGQQSCTKKGLWGRFFSKKNDTESKPKPGKLKQEKDGVETSEKNGTSANDKVVYLTDEEIAELDE
jgi:hypothetical protein